MVSLNIGLKTFLEYAGSSHLAIQMLRSLLSIKTVVNPY